MARAAIPPEGRGDAHSATRSFPQHRGFTGTPPRTRRTAMADAAHCDGRCSALRWRMQRTAMADAAHCDGRCSALRWRMQRTALADAAHCDGGCSALRWRMQRTAIGREENWVERVKMAAREKHWNPRDTVDASPTCDKASVRILTPPWDTPLSPKRAAHPHSWLRMGGTRQSARHVTPAGLPQEGGRGKDAA